MIDSKIRELAGGRRVVLTKAEDLLPLTEAFFYILLVLYSCPSHGYGIMQEAEKISEERVQIGAGTLYTALNTLLKKGWIKNADTPQGADPRRKMYRITERGEAVLYAETRRLKSMLGHASQILE